MHSVGNARPVFRFGSFILDASRACLRDGEREIELRPKSFDILRYLVERPGQLLSKDELMQAIWPNLFVTDNSLTRCISEVRQALGHEGQRMIKTVPKRGYLFAVPVQTGETVLAPAAEAPAARELIEGPSVAVLPFANLSGDAAQDYLSDGITEDIINELSCFSGLSIIARHSSFSFKARAIDVREIGRRLGVRYIVEGSVRRFGDRIRISAQLVDADSGVQRWTERFDRALGDVFSVQDEITQAIVRIVVSHLGAAEQERVARKSTSSWTAYDLLMQGDGEWRVLEQRWAIQHMLRAHQLYQEAYKVEPDNALICARLALSFVRAHGDPANPDCGNAESLKRGHEMAIRAVSLDPNLPYARAQLGWVYFWMNQIDDAIGEFEKAVAVNRNFSDIHFPAVLNFAGEPKKALDLLRAEVRLDPFHPTQVHAIQGHSLFLLGHYQEAIEPLSECIRRSPRNVLGQVWLAATLIQVRKFVEARALIAELRERLPHLNLSQWRLFSLYRDRSNSDRMIAALHKAGLH